MRFVAVKSAEQQAVLSLHRIRQQLVKIRTMQAHQVRGLLYEFGVVVPQGWRALLAQAGPILADETHCAVPGLVRRELLRQLDGIGALTTRIAELERQMESWQRRESECQRIAAIPGVGRLTASAVVATVADARKFRSGREFAAFLGLVPRQSGTGGRVKLLGISKRGDPYLRTLLIHGARAALPTLSRSATPLGEWLRGLSARAHVNTVVVALANKLARIAWAVLRTGRSFDAAAGARA